MQEIAVTTAYTGGKMMDADKSALDRISTVDEDEEHLERFWEESRSDICQELIGLVAFEGMVVDLPTDPIEPMTSNPAVPSLKKQHYELRLDVSQSFDNALLPSMTISLRNFFVYNIVGKWYVYTNKESAGDYADKAATLLDDIHRKAVYKKKPARPVYND